MAGTLAEGAVIHGLDPGGRAAGAHHIQSGHEPTSPASRPCEPLPGSLTVEYKTCGTRGCRCRRGQLHGPYTYRRWREGGRLRRQYVSAAHVAEVLRAMAAWRQLHQPIWPARQALTQIRAELRARG
jgi:hypothetical protein